MRRPLFIPLSAVAWLVGACGGRTGLESASAGLALSSASDASDGLDGPAESSGDSPGVAFADGSTSAGACLPEPARGRAVASLNGDIAWLAVRGSTLFIGTSDTGSPSPFGTISEVPVTGGEMRPLVTPGYILGIFAFDASRVYYPRSTVTPRTITQTRLAARDLTTGTVSEVPTPQRFMDFAAGSAHPGVFWTGGPVKPTEVATTLYSWDPESDTNSVLATGEDLVGVAVDESRVYWTDTGGHQVTVYAAPLGGGPTSVLATVPWRVARGGLIGLSSKSVVFASDFSVGSVEAVDKTGGPVEHVMTSPFLVAAVGDENLYWSPYAHQGRLERMPIAGGVTERMWEQPGDGYVEAVAFDACNVYIGLTNVGQVYARGK